ncbi:ammonium transporter [Aliiruegeria lutimaris]|uniref:Ammonium transporter n=1 Tax=Aliiruegeria lutimaris TaxID=571298 RepID=A0A1G9GFY8_9RHOB|nr:ammonium transporter [Aliiruegeria lutimaris]SDK99455.1 ammonium transporter, Amt family [Aliiruegeria lutimaris]
MNVVDLLWLVLASALVFLMQAGFLCLETGMTRSKNSINVAIKNLADFCLSTFVFWGVGFGLMFGLSQGGWFGTDLFALDLSASSPSLAVFFLFQVMFCGAAVTILSGVVAERMKFGAYLFVSFIVAGVLYPIAGHWTWAGLAGFGGSGWLADLGFVDFAGSTVVHSVGGWAGLALVLVVGPRIGRFDHGANKSKIVPSSMPLATLGAILLFIGWLGFNGGSTLALNENVPGILVNTVIGGCIGAISAGGLSYAVRHSLDVDQFINGTLGGLVAVTANCFAVSTGAAALIGLVGGMIVFFFSQILEGLKIDDAVGAIPVHLGAGIWGTMATGLYGDLETLDTGLGRLEQIAVQALGVLAYGVWTFGLALIVFYLGNLVFRFRVDAEGEILGLNITEHGIRHESEVIPAGPPLLESEA